MAISDAKKVDYLWKKLGYGATKTDTNAAKKAPNEAIASPLLLRGDKVWQQASDIPTVMPGSNTAVVTVYPTSLPDECTNDGTAAANRTWKTGLTDWIPPEIGSTYQLKVYIHTSGDAANAASGGTQVFATGSGNNDEWFFDYQSGVVHFIGSNLPNGVNFTGKSVYVSGARYTGTFGVGGASSSLGDITAEGTTLTTPTNDDLILDPQGTGIVKINTTSSMKLPYGTTAQRPSSPEEGEIRYNSTLDIVEVYKNGAWVRVGDPDTATLSNDTFDGDGSDTTFTLSNSASTNTVIVTLNGVVQEPTTDYTVSGTTLTFTTAPVVGDRISAKVFSSITYLDRIQDADSDTKVEVERTSDDDTVRITVAGTDRITVTSTATTISGLTHNVQNITGPGAISLTETATLLTTTGANAYTLANGTEGQIKIISMKVDGGNATVTPTSFVNGTQIVFNDVEDTITLLYQSTGWVVLARQNATVS
ncbi:MAG: hypothetical protein CMA64_08610 [Euryarchaeota archaeon]|nr:hypothetical protein [Euryarchaeota archaeon]